MNTKLLLVITIFFCLIPVLSINGASKKQALHFALELSASPHAPNQPKQTPDALVWFVHVLPVDAASHHSSDHKEESHCLCFDRFRKARRRNILVFIIKCLMTLIHISIFAGITLHLIH